MTELPDILTEQQFEGVTLKDRSLAGANLTASHWRNCTFDCVNLEDADLSGATFEDCRFIAGYKKGYGDRATATGAQFLRCTFTNMQFVGARFDNTRLIDIEVPYPLHLMKADCRGMELSLICDATYGPSKVQLVGANLEGARLSARLSEREAKRILGMGQQRWSEFSIQRASVNDRTTIEYKSFALDKPVPAPELRGETEGGRVGRLSCVGWGTICEVLVHGDLVVACEGSWNGDNKRYGADGHYRVACWRAGDRLWERKLVLGSGSEDVRIRRVGDQLHCLSPFGHWVLAFTTGEIVEEKPWRERCYFELGYDGAVLVYGDKVTIERGAHTTTVEGSLKEQSPDGPWLVVTRDEAWSVYDYAAETERFKGKGELTAAAFTHDGSKLAVAREHEIEVFDCATGKSLAKFDSAPENKRKPEIKLLRWDASGRRLAAIHSSVCVWNADAHAREFSPARMIGKLDPPVKSLDFSANGTVLYVGAGLLDEARAVSMFVTEEPPKKSKSKAKAPAKRR